MPRSNFTTTELVCRFLCAEKAHCEAVLEEVSHTCGANYHGRRALVVGEAPDSSWVRRVVHVRHNAPAFATSKVTAWSDSCVRAGVMSNPTDLTVTGVFRQLLRMLADNN